MPRWIDLSEHHAKLTVEIHPHEGRRLQISSTVASSPLPDVTLLGFNRTDQGIYVSYRPRITLAEFQVLFPQAREVEFSLDAIFQGSVELGPHHEPQTAQDEPAAVSDATLPLTSSFLPPHAVPLAVFEQQARLETSGGVGPILLWHGKKIPLPTITSSLREIHQSLLLRALANGQTVPLPALGDHVAALTGKTPGGRAIRNVMALLTQLELLDAIGPTQERFIAVLRRPPQLDLILEVLPGANGRQIHLRQSTAEHVLINELVLSLPPLAIRETATASAQGESRGCDPSAAAIFTDTLMEQKFDQAWLVRCERDGNPVPHPRLLSQSVNARLRRYAEEASTLPDSARVNYAIQRVLEDYAMPGADVPWAEWLDISAPPSDRLALSTLLHNAITQTHTLRESLPPLVNPELLSTERAQAMLETHRAALKNLRQHHERVTLTQLRALALLNPNNTIAHEQEQQLQTTLTSLQARFDAAEQRYQLIRSDRERQASTKASRGFAPFQPERLPAPTPEIVGLAPDPDVKNRWGATIVAFDEKPQTVYTNGVILTRIPPIAINHPSWLEALGQPSHYTNFANTDAMHRLLTTKGIPVQPLALQFPGPDDVASANGDIVLGGEDGYVTHRFDAGLFAALRQQVPYDTLMVQSGTNSLLFVQDDQVMATLAPRRGAPALTQADVRHYAGLAPSTPLPDFDADAFKSEVNEAIRLLNVDSHDPEFQTEALAAETVIERTTRHQYLVRRADLEVAIPVTEVATGLFRWSHDNAEGARGPLVLALSGADEQLKLIARRNEQKTLQQRALGEMPEGATPCQAEVVAYLRQLATAPDWVARRLDDVAPHRGYDQDFSQRYATRLRSRGSITLVALPEGQVQMRDPATGCAILLHPVPVINGFAQSGRGLHNLIDNVIGQASSHFDQEAEWLRTVTAHTEPAGLTNLAKRIERALPQRDLSRKRATARHYALALANKDVLTLGDILLNNENRICRQLFTELTSRTLPVAQSKARAVIDNWCGVTAEEREAIAAAKAADEREREAQKELSRLTQQLSNDFLRVDGVKKTIKAFIDDAIAEGYVLDTHRRGATQRYRLRRDLEFGRFLSYDVRAAWVPYIDAAQRGRQPVPTEQNVDAKKFAPEIANQVRPAAKALPVKIGELREAIGTLEYVLRDLQGHTREEYRRADVPGRLTRASDTVEALLPRVNATRFAKDIDWARRFLDNARTMIADWQAVVADHGPRELGRGDAWSYLANHGLQDSAHIERILKTPSNHRDGGNVRVPLYSTEYLDEAARDTRKVAPA